MILYLDTSALVKLYIEEEGTDEVQRAVEGAESVAASAVAYPEARSAFARLERGGYLSPEDHRTIVSNLDVEWPSYEVVDVTRDLAGIAGALAARHVLRGFDAVHLASAVVLKAARGLYSREASERGEAGMPPQVRLMTYDGSLLAAARREDLAYEMPNAASEDDSI